MSRCFVWDASPLVHASRIDRLDVLGDLASAPAGGRQHVTTSAVAQEVVRQGGEVPSWLVVVHVDGIGELFALGQWVGRVATSSHSQGEASVLAWAEVHGALALIDDSDARRVARQHGLEVHGLLWVAAQAVLDGRWSVAGVSGLLDHLLASGARYPFESGGFAEWAISVRLLPSA